MSQSITIPESAYTLKYNLSDVLFPKINPNLEGRLKVSDLHELWYAEYGNPSGMPVIFLHGGPGGGCSPYDARFFNPAFYRIILFDQRGSGRSIPLYELQDNNTQELVADIEKIRIHLKINKWLIFGGSWGSLLSILYGQAHPERCLGFVLRGVVMGSEAELANIYAMGDIFPESFDEFEKFLPENERGNLMQAYFKRFCDPDLEVALSAARAFAKYDIGAAFLLDSSEKVERILADEGVFLAMAKFFTYYAVNKCFLSANQVINNLDKISHLPAIIIHGRYDVICRVQSAYKLHKNWAGSELYIIQDAGHASTEPGIAKMLVYATERMRERFTK